MPASSAMEAPGVSKSGRKNAGKAIVFAWGTSLSGGGSDSIEEQQQARMGGLCSAGGLGDSA